MTRRKAQDEATEAAGGVPAAMIQQAEAAALAAREDELNAHQDSRVASEEPGRPSSDSLNTSIYPESTRSVDTSGFVEPDPSELDVPPPAYGDHYGEIQEVRDGLDTKATVGDDGRVVIRIDEQTQKWASILGNALQQEQHLAEEDEPPPPPYIPPSLGGKGDEPPPPPMNVVIHVVGSRGDVQPFVALGKVLKETYGHRVRLATHPNFQDFVSQNGLEFFNIGGDPTKLMAFMVKNPGLMPGIDSLKSGDIGNRRNEVREMLKGCWRSCYEAGNGTGVEATDTTVEDWTLNPSSMEEGEANRPFVADVIIANPPSFAHIHIAEKLGIPLHIMFTMPYSPTQAFPHPLANIQSSNADANLTNYMSYTMVEMLTWQGLGDVINDFRKRSLNLDSIGMLSSQILQRLKVPHTYCWSPALIPKPKDWRQHITVSGFFFLNLASNYTPAPDLKEFLDGGPPPVYIGFGSIVLDDPNGMTKLIFEAVRKSGRRALVSQGWGGMGAEDLGKPDDVFMLGNCPHDWLFPRVSCVVHHGGAGTTAAGITAGKPTVVVPFFGDQPFWGAMVARAGAGPEPIPHKQLTSDNLAEAIKFCLAEQSQGRAKELASKIAQEKGTDNGAQTFHQFLDTDQLRCNLAPSRSAVWRIKGTQVRLSAMAACTLANQGILDFKDLKLFRPREYETDSGPFDPITGGAASIVGTTSAMMGAVMDMPLDTFNQIKINKAASKEKAARQAELNKQLAESDKAFSAQVRAGTEQSVTENTVPSTRPSVASSEAAMTSGTITPVTSHSGSTFNLEESFARMGSPTPSIGRPETHRTASTSSSQTRGPIPPPTTQASFPQLPQDTMKHLETAASTGKGISKIIGLGFKSPMEFTDNLARGFHNAPKLYGDETVRKNERITGFKSGIVAASREFGLGMYDGITGLVTQPMKGAQKEGPAGFLKGVGKGIGGIVLKPGAAIFAIPGYTMKGVYKEVQSMLGSSVQNYIIAARTAQGFDEWNRSSPEEREDVTKRFLRLQKQLKKKMKAEDLVRSIMDEQRQNFSSGKGKMRRADTGTSSAVAGRAGESQRSDPEAAMMNMGARPEKSAVRQAAAPASVPDADSDLAAAIHLSVQETSRGNANEDAEVERAIRASMAEHARNRGTADANDEESEALRKAMAASLAEAKNAAEHGNVDAARHDEDLEQALANSLREQRRQHGSDSEWDSDPNTENDEDFQRAITESQHATSGAQTATHPDEPPPAYEESSIGKSVQSDVKSSQERSEEEVVMAYVKKQSMLEQKHRHDQAQKQGESSSSAVAGGDEDEELKKALEMSMRDQRKGN